MRRVRLALQRWEALALLGCVFLVLYTWPLVTSAAQGRAWFVFVYYYTVFALHIVVLALVAGVCGPDNGSDSGTGAGHG
jgi:hypothetical protein